MHSGLTRITEDKAGFALGRCYLEISLQYVSVSQTHRSFITSSAKTETPKTFTNTCTSLNCGYIYSLYFKHCAIK